MQMVDSFQTPLQELWTEDKLHVHDLNATILCLLGLDHEKLTYCTQGRDFRLTDMHGKVVEKLLA